jgi:hypothetical protein
MPIVAERSRPSQSTRAGGLGPEKPETLLAIQVTARLLFGRKAHPPRRTVGLEHLLVACRERDSNSRSLDTSALRLQQGTGDAEANGVIDICA